MSQHRKTLPQRRYAETFEVEHGGLNKKFAVTIGYHPNGDIGEVFISGAKTGSDLDAANRDNAIFLSLCLQHGVPLETIQHAITREENGAPSTMIGVVIDRLMRDNVAKA